MKIKKIGHCCLQIKIDNLTVLTDPGAYSEEQSSISGIDVVLITHEHVDHLHVGSLKNIISNNPNVQIFTNSGVAKILDKENIKYSLLEGKSTTNISGLVFEAFDSKHEEIYGEIGQVKNTGYFLNNRFFYPGDSFALIDRPVEILALPVAGPWCNVRDAVNYALKIKPKKVFPVHDGMLQADRIGAAHNVTGTVLVEKGIEFIPMKNGDEKEF